MLESLEEQTAKLAEAYDIALDELHQLEDDVAAAEEAVAEKQAEVAELQAQLGDVAVQAYVESGATGMGIFSEPAEFSEELQRDELTRVALNSGTADSDDLEQAVTELSEQQGALEEQRAAAADKTEEVADAQQAAEEQTAELQQAQAEAEAELGELIREEQERRARESFERMQAEAAAARPAPRRRPCSCRGPAARATPARAARRRVAAVAAQPGAGGGGGGGANPRRAVAAAVRSGARPRRPAPIPAASSRAGTAVSAALSQQGVSYRFAAASPGVAFDCSGLTSWAWSQAGVYLPHQSAQQYASIPHVPSSAAQPGDLIFYYSPISHVGMYIGGGQMVHATSPGDPVQVASVNWGNVTGVGRPS